MASFSATYPFAYHVLPLHLAKPIWQQGALWSKQQLAEAAPNSAPGRATTRLVDYKLGLANYVHLYLLPRRISFPFAALPILHTQLKPASLPPFPHIVLRVPTAQLDDAECTLCLWNAAVSRPGVPSAQIKGGNWTRGTRPGFIVEAWRKFRAESLDEHRRRGFWHEGVELPLLAGAQIAANLNLLRRAPQGCPELLIRGQLPLHHPMKLYVFAKADAEILALLGDPPGGMNVHIEPFSGYEPEQAEETRAAIRVSFSDLAAELPQLDYDRRR